jgi:hypothetical protein
MAYNIKNHLYLWTCPTFEILNNKKTAFPTLDLFPSSGYGMETPTLLAPLQPNLISVGVSFPSTEEVNIFSLRNVVF